MQERLDVAVLKVGRSHDASRWKGLVPVMLQVARCLLPSRKSRWAGTMGWYGREQWRAKHVNPRPRAVLPHTHGQLKARTCVCACLWGILLCSRDVHSAIPSLCWGSGVHESLDVAHGGATDHMSISDKRYRPRLMLCCHRFVPSKIDDRVRVVEVAKRLKSVLTRRDTSHRDLTPRYIYHGRLPWGG
jgi:hypothetical protein